MLPIIEGHVRAGDAGGSRLRLRHRLAWFTLVFALIWLGAAGTGLVVKLLQGSGEALLLLALFFFGALLFTVPFWWEADKSQPLLLHLLELEPAAEQPYN